jgi:hypothetical protein
MIYRRYVHFSNFSFCSGIPPGMILQISRLVVWRVAGLVLNFELIGFDPQTLVSRIQAYKISLLSLLLHSFTLPNIFKVARKAASTQINAIWKHHVICHFT